MRFNGILVAACLTVLLVPAVDADAQVFNRAPQQAESSIDIEWPIHYGRHDRALMETAAGLAGSAEYELRRFLDLHTAARYEDALVAARRVAELAPDRALVHYNLACVLSRLQQVEAGFAALEDALSHGWRNDLQALIDPDLRHLRDDARFQRWLNDVRRRAEAERVHIDARRVEPWQEVAHDIARTVPGLMRRYHVPGIAVALVRQGTVVWSQGYGHADTNGHRRFAVDRPFLSRAGLDLLTLAAAVRLDDGHDLRLEDLVMESLARRDRTDPATAFSSRGGRLASRRGGARVQTDVEGGVVLTSWPRVESSMVAARLRAVIGDRTSRTFDAYCNHVMLDALELDDTVTAPGAELLESAAPGFTQLGTCIPPSIDDGLDAMLTTTADLAALAAGLVAGAERPILEPHHRARLAEVAALDLSSLGVSVAAVQTADGPVLQAADLRGGLGCLVRAFPESGDAVVIVFNSVTGPDAALRIAQLALGGGTPVSREQQGATARD